ncbi:MAG: AMP-binding protein [Streptosporangiaceae bacterium]|jgi:2-aminobenzoate-CoA ligase
MQLSPSAHTDTFCRDHLPAASDWPELRFSLPALAYPERLNCAAALLEATIAAGGAGRPCLLSPSENWSYGDLLRVSGQIARVLAEDLGVVPGNRVLLRGPNNPWLVACWFGVLRAGAVAVATMPLLRAGELAAIREIAAVTLALCDSRFTGALAEAAGAEAALADPAGAAAAGPEAAGPDLPGMRIVSYGGDGPDDLTRLASRKPAGMAAVPTAADDVALIAFTSGTTGRPKATLHFHRDVLAVADTFSEHVLKPVADDVFAGTPPLAFTFGLGAEVIFPLRAGAAVLLLEKATPAEFADQIAARGVTVCFTAPTAYRAMLAAGKAPALRGLRRAVSAGEHLPASTWQAFYDATGVKIIDGIGSTELLHIFISSADEEIRPGATGRVVPGYLAEIIGADGVPVPDGEPGLLAVKGPTGCRYLAGDRQRSYVRDGWNITGDTYRRDADGYFWYEARSDDIIISSGYNIAGPEVEEALLSHPEVAECGVVGVPDEARGQIVKAYVVLADGAGRGEAKVSELQDYVKQRIAPYKYPRAIEFVPALPRTSTGKLQRYRLRQRGTG